MAVLDGDCGIDLETVCLTGLACVMMALLSALLPEPPTYSAHRRPSTMKLLPSLTLVALILAVALSSAAARPTDAGFEPPTPTGVADPGAALRARFLADQEPAQVMTPLAFTPCVAGMAGVYPCSNVCLLYTSPSPRDRTRSRMPSSA